MNPPHDPDDEWCRCYDCGKKRITDTQRAGVAEVFATFLPGLELPEDEEEPTS